MNIILNTDKVDPIVIGGTGPAGPQGTVGPQGLQGLQGIQGPPGIAFIGGYSVSLTDEAVDDVLSFNGGNWVNKKQETLADGGNF
jgi:hypothetical protein